MSTQFQTLIDGLTIAQEQNQISERLKQVAYNNHKQFLPFSDRLNEWLQDWYVDSIQKGLRIIFVDEDGFEGENIEAYYKKCLGLFNDEKKINIWKGASYNTIFGKAEINWIMRAWHDYSHFTNNLSFHPMHEIMLAKIQMAELPQDWWYEKALVDAEISGQILYYEKYKEFPTDQRAFILDYLRTGKLNKH